MKIFGGETKVVNPASDPVPVTSSPSMAQIVYEDGAVMYVCKAPVGSSASAPVWQVQKVDALSGVIITWADGDDDFDNVATNLITVKAFDFA